MPAWVVESRTIGMTTRRGGHGADEEWRGSIVAEDFDVGRDGDAIERGAVGAEVGFGADDHLDGVAERGDGGEEGSEVAAGAAAGEDVAFVGGRGVANQLIGIDLEGHVKELPAAEAEPFLENGRVAEVDEKAVDAAERPADERAEPGGGSPMKKSRVVMRQRWKGIKKRAREKNITSGREK